MQLKTIIRRVNKETKTICLRLLFDSFLINLFEGIQRLMGKLINLYLFILWRLWEIVTTMIRFLKFKQNLPTNIIFLIKKIRLIFLLKRIFIKFYWVKNVFFKIQFVARTHSRYVIPRSSIFQKILLFYVFFISISSSG